MEINFVMFSQYIQPKETKLGITIIQTTSQTSQNEPTTKPPLTQAYTKPPLTQAYTCKDCNKHYISKTQCNLEKRIHKHNQSINQSIKTNDDQNALFSPHARIHTHSIFPKSL